MYRKGFKHAFPAFYDRITDCEATMMICIIVRKAMYLLLNLLLGVELSAELSDVVHLPFGSSANNPCIERRDW